MKRLFIIEVEEPVQGATQRVALDPAKLAYKASQSSNDAIAKSVKPVANAVIGNVKRLVEPPDEVEVSFGLVSMEAGAVITNVGGNANFTVKLKWIRAKKVENPGG